MPTNIPKTAAFWSATGMPSTYDKYIGSKPLLETAFLGGTGALGGYAFGDAIMRNMVPAIMAGKSPLEKQKALEELRQDGTLNTIRMMLAGMGGAAGVGYSVIKHGQLRRGFKELASSMRNPEYWDEHPDELQSNIAKMRQSYRSIPYELRRKYYSSGRQEKTSAEEGVFMAPRVPVHTSLELINGDPFLHLNEKTVTNQILSSAGEGRSGLLSGHDLMQSAIQAGAGAGVGYVFGKVAGSLLSLPTVVTQRLSAAGALAGALINTGLFSEILHAI